MSGHAHCNLTRGFRIEIENSEVENNEFQCDGELFKATRVQCSFVPTKNIMQLCVVRTKH